MTPNLLQYLSRPLRPHATLLALWAVCGILLSIFDSQSRNVSFPYDTAYRLLVIGAPNNFGVATRNLSSHNHLRRSESESLLQDLGRLPNSKLG
jgi:hypothetical protein